MSVLIVLFVVLIFACWRPRRVPRELELAFFAGDSSMPSANVDFKSGRTQRVRVGGVDDQGQAVPIDRVEFAASSDESVVTVEIDEQDPLQLLLRGFAPGTAVIQVTGDVQLGTGFESVTTPLNVIVLPNNAVSLTFQEIEG